MTIFATYDPWFSWLCFIQRRVIVHVIHVCDRRNGCEGATDWLEGLPQSSLVHIMRGRSRMLCGKLASFDVRSFKLTSHKELCIKETNLAEMVEASQLEENGRPKWQPN